MLRSDIRHTCYRMKNKANVSANNEYLVDIIEKKIPVGESWATFSDKWDVLIDNDGNIHTITPETDYDYVHSICLEIALSAKHNIPLNLDTRGQNVLSIIELNMMET